MITEWATARGHSLETYAVYDGVVLPNITQLDGLIIMGGPMSVHDEDLHPWLAEEKIYIQHALCEKKRVMGVCLGAQLIADAMGATISTMPQKEIGWHPIAYSDAMMGHPLIAKLNTAMSAFHWHGECFSIPKGAQPLASSQACANQGFWHEQGILALQCHLEMDAPAIEAICDACSTELSETSPYIQSAETIERNIQHIPAMRSALFHMLDYWAR